MRNTTGYGCVVDSSPGAAPVQSVDRAMRILQIVARAGEVGVSDVAAELGVHKSTAFRLVASLERHRVVEQVGERGKYRLGVGILRLAGATTARLDVVQESRSVARRLAAQTRETVNVAVLAEGSALYLDQAAGPSAVQSHNWVGQHIPLHATANGKVLLSGVPDAELGSFVQHRRAYTDRTITSLAALRRDISRARERGYALAVDELEVGLTALAAPIRNAYGDVIASISVSGPTFRLDDDRVVEVAGLLRAAAEEVSHRLGSGPPDETS